MFVLLGPLDAACAVTSLSKNHDCIRKSHFSYVGSSNCNVIVHRFFYYGMQ